MVNELFTRLDSRWRDVEMTDIFTHLRSPVVETLTLCGVTAASVRATRNVTAVTCPECLLLIDAED